ncbi:glycoside hydrolase [Mycena filopes]|nr:glycoside hydrolase [Mycena filopes]
MFALLVLATLAARTAASQGSQQLYLDQRSFPKIEGAWNVDGKSESIWDHFLHNKPKWPMATTFDFTISWTRIMPGGRGALSDKGVQFYQNVIRASNASGMANICTLYHWDLPQSLQAEYGGWLNRKIVDDFRAYARAVFQVFGNQCSRWVFLRAMNVANKRTYKDQYTCMHFALLAHAAAVDELEKVDGGVSLPLNPSNPADQAAAARAMDFEVGRDVAPLYTGDYPPSVLATGALPLLFSPAEKQLLKGSVDFIGLDFYTSQWVTTTPHCVRGNDAYPNPHTGLDIGRPTASDWNFDAPHATIYEGIKYGMGVLNETNLPLAQVLEDVDRIAWYRGVLTAMKQALDEGLPLTGFIPWSCIDNFEWTDGYNVRFGLINVAYNAAGQAFWRVLRGVLTQGNPINPYNFAP